MWTSLQEKSLKELVCPNSHSGAYKHPSQGTWCRRGRHRARPCMAPPCPQSLVLPIREGSTPCLPKQGSRPPLHNAPLLSSFSFSLLTRQMRICSHLSPCDSAQTKHLRLTSHPKPVFCSNPVIEVVFTAMQFLVYWLGNNRGVCPIIAPDKPSEYRTSKRLSTEP